MNLPTAVRATGWSAVDVVIRQAIQFIVGIALARLLEPSAFGALAIMQAVTNLAGALVDGGFSSALIQRQGLTRRDESTVFWFSVGSATVLAVTLALSSRWIGLALGMQEFPGPFAAICSVLVISAVGAVPITMMTRQLDFRSQALMGLSAFLASAPVAIFLASRGFGVWALVWQAIVAASVTTVASWILSGWRPQFCFDFASLRSMFRFGGFMLGTIAVDTAAARAPALLLGTAGGLTAVGFYSRAESTAGLPTSVLQRIVPRVVFPAYASIGGDRRAICRGALRALRAVSLISMPAIFGVSALAEAFVTTLFGDKWVPSASLLGVMALAGIGIPFQLVNLSALMATGQSKRFFFLHLGKKALLLGAVGVASQFGVLPMAVTFTVMSIAGGVLDLVYAGRWIGLEVRPQVQAVLPALAASAMMWLLLTFFVAVSELSQPVELVSGIGLGAMLYGATLLLLRVPVAVQLMRRFASGIRGT